MPFPSTSREPLVVGRYAIYGEIASGGMATVHFGRLVGPIGFSRTVAIKRLHPQYAKDPDFVAMFLDEARIAARIQHPNVVPTLDVVSTDGEIFLVLEYVQGETLSRLMRAMRERTGQSVVPVPPRIAGSIAAGVLHGLHAAHEAKDERGHPLNIVHRDVSPQNVIVGADGVPRLLDFGIAKAAVRLQTTRDGQLKGKIAYMAPEQLSSGLASRLCDVYSCGVMLWEALTGKRLFEAETEGQLLAQVMRSSVEPPSALVRDLPPAVDAIVMRALDRDPLRRFATARELALALERSTELAMPSEVGDWVEAIAREGLARRAERVKEIESSTHATRPPPSSSAAQLVSRLRASDEATEIQPAPGSAPDATAVSRMPSVAPARPVTTAPIAARRRVLVIDDSEVMLARIRRALEIEGYDVTTTSRAVGNARHIATADLAIIDYHMPGIDGGTVIASLREAAKASAGRASQCLFYLYTSDQTLAREYQKLGFDGCFTEKGDEAALVRQVRAVFRVLSMRALKKK